MERPNARYLETLAHAINAFLEDVRKEQNIPEKLGFALMVFRLGEYETEQGIGGDYVSNASREDMIRVMRETANRLEKGIDDNRSSDIEPP